MSTVINPVIAPAPAAAPFAPGPLGTHITIRGLTKYFAGWPLYEDFNLDIPKGKI
ncbi:MAG: ABC transporter ATP-binding protein, partial [Achromobacter spanius]